MKVDPPLLVLNPVAVTVDNTLKSDAIPVVAPLAPETLIVHPTASPIRDGFVLVQSKVLDAVGLPYTTNVVVALVTTEFVKVD